MASKEHCGSDGGSVQLLADAFRRDDARSFRELLDQDPSLKTRINDPVGCFDSPLVTQVRSRDMLDVLVEAGADLNAKSRWWAGGFGLLHSAPPDVAEYAIERGAKVDIHAAARLGKLDQLKELLASDPTLVRARGGDGQTPLHFAASVEVAKILLDHGAEIDALDLDHESTPAQYMVGDRQSVARYLVEQGCKTDLLLASALGNRDLVLKHLNDDPECIRMRVNDDYFPKSNPKSGGTIYQWTLGWHVSAHDVAKKFGHDAIHALLMERSPADVRLLVNCWEGNETAVRSILEQSPNLAAELTDSDRQQVSHAARNNNTAAVQLMLTAGFPVDARGQHGATPLHWAGFHGNADMAKIILQHEPPLEQTDADFKGTPLGWTIHGSLHGWYSQSGDYGATAEVLLKAGAKAPVAVEGSQAVQDVLARFTGR